MKKLVFGFLKRASLAQWAETANRFRLARAMISTVC